MSFLPKSPSTVPQELMNVIIANSAVVAVGEVVALNSTGYVTNGAAAAPLLGVVVGFCKNDGTPLNPTAYVAGTATGTDVQSVTASASNVTGNKYRAIVSTSKRTRYSVNVSGTLGTTADSPTATDDAIGGWVDVDSSGSNYARVLESTFTRTAGAATNFFCWGVDPADTTRYLVSIADSLLDNEQS